VDVFLGATLIGQYNITPGQTLAPTFSGKIGGPLKVVPRSGYTPQNLVVSQRVLYNGSFNEVMGLK